MITIVRQQPARPMWPVLGRWAKALVLAGIIAACSCIVAGAAPPGHIYTLAQVDAGLARDAHAWLHRTLLVRALLGGTCMARADGVQAACIAWSFALLDPSGNRAIDPLPLGWDPPPAWLRCMRRIPLLQQLIPAPQVLALGIVANYRIQLQATPCAGAAGSVCYSALALDAQPPGQSV